MHKSVFALLNRERYVCSYDSFFFLIVRSEPLIEQQRTRVKNGFRLFLEHIIARVSDVDDDYYDYYFVWFLSFSFYFSIWLALTCLPCECMRDTSLRLNTIYRIVNSELSRFQNIYTYIYIPHQMSRCMLCMSARFCISISFSCCLLLTQRHEANLTMAHIFTFQMPCICVLRNIKNYEKKYSLFLSVSLFVLFRPIYIDRGSEHNIEKWMEIHSEWKKKQVEHFE